MIRCIFVIKITFYIQCNLKQIADPFITNINKNKYLFRFRFNLAYSSSLVSKYEFIESVKQISWSDLATIFTSRGKLLFASSS
jgi:hypothetical protein